MSAASTVCDTLVSTPLTRYYLQTVTRDDGRAPPYLADRSFVSYGTETKDADLIIIAGNAETHVNKHGELEMKKEIKAVEDLNFGHGSSLFACVIIVSVKTGGVTRITKS
ncbi:hypothetical protein PPACK8108_LOCUS4756 [Phakopsora pachyrhizi]|uniref:Uncharacterized protein n=1 Tax=Phakopsora pachyrhizi TaxID=170000 RepID=A0AAV0AQ90_PHAPC|nr:hypothetical protein PPACK8108_LOCUS4756 [Phakopsora pachyrhizi]